MGFEYVDDETIFPITKYIRSLRNRLQHYLYPDRIADEDIIMNGKILTSYSFPVFKRGQHICLTENDIKALVFETRAQLAEYLVPYINRFLQNRYK